MIQRIQTIYLLLVLIVSGGISFVALLWTSMAGDNYYLTNMIDSNSWGLISIPIGFIISALLSFWSVLKFKNRKEQIKLNRFNIVSNLYLLGIFVYQLLTLSGENEISVKGIGLFLPVIAIVLLVLANKSIQKDEELVKSVDRLR